MGITLDLHPVVVLVSLAFWTLCWGPPGALLSTPMTCMLILGLREISHPLAASAATLLSHGRRRPRSKAETREKRHRSSISSTHSSTREAAMSAVRRAEKVRETLQRESNGETGLE